MYTYNYMSIYICLYNNLYEYLYLLVYSNYMSIYSYFFFVCNRIHLNKICLSCFVDIHLYSNNLSTIATISSLIELKILPASFSFSINFSLSHSSLGSDDEKVVFDSLRF